MLPRNVLIVKVKQEPIKLQVIPLNLTQKCFNCKNKTRTNKITSHPTESSISLRHPQHISLKIIIERMFLLLEEIETGSPLAYPQHIELSTQLRNVVK